MVDAWPRWALGMSRLPDGGYGLPMSQEWVLISGKSKARLGEDAVVFVHAGFAPSKVQRRASPHSVAYAEIVLVEFKEAGWASSGYLAVATHDGVHPRHLENPSAFAVAPGTPEEKLRAAQFAGELLRRCGLSGFGHLRTRGLFQSAKAELDTTPAPPPPADSTMTSAHPPLGPSGHTKTVAPQPGTPQDGEPAEGEASAATARPSREVQVRPPAPGAAPADLEALVEERARTLAAAEAGVEQALRRFKEIEKAAGAAARSSAKAKEHTRIMSIGMVRQVTLYDLHIQLPRSRVPMSTEVHATAENQGTKQVMPGSIWTGPQTADRREMWLHVTWPEGFEAVHWQRNDDSITGASVKPAQVHEMAAAINRAAQRYPQAAAYDARSREIADRELAHARARLRSEATALLTGSEGHAQAAAAVRAVADDLAGREDLQRRQQRSTKDLASRAARVQRSAGEAIERGRKLQEQLTAAGGGGGALPPAQRGQLGPASRPAREPASEPGDQRPALLRSAHDAMDQLLEQREHQPPPPATAPADPGSPDPATSLTQLLAQLGQLRDAGVLTEEEFTAKKTEILNRL